MSGRAPDSVADERLLFALCLGVLLLIAGCATVPFGGPAGQEGPARIILNNSANETHTFEVSVVELPAEYTIRSNAVGNTTTSIDQGLTSHNPGDNQTFSAVELPESARLHGRYTLVPGETKQTSIEEFPRRFAIVVVISQEEGEIVWYVTLNCDEQALTGLRVIRWGDWVSTAHSCD